ncbi:hypothetical protein A3A39_02320 [Candidatus Kaiserbacteria bacterium RIFCSPLOWO2_01_FULL_54_13]|uniref:Uncharacterized protein n=1 Tax=Candidatus Kaiserbacteria bacterium RIFCSPLOWO2_01_FULL_54_13 TaxID=1798512 RepID=A0A1F6F1A7_9BACT|nr:MAG: hypothetical protein A3A39_02320 [Candidatus Kaiserbacteria bacterium RIFCSPLOWO2_01_FULL_54_13]
MAQRGYTFYLTVLLVLIATLWILATVSPEYPETWTIGQGVGSFKELQDRFAALAREKGVTYAFEVAKRAKLPPNSDIHFLGHTIGDELYKQKGIEGIVDCTQDFRNACSHSITIGAFVEFGSEALPMIREACKQAPGGPGAYTMCYHGMGHGVFAYFGYDLAKTIAECKKTGTEEYHNQEYTECVGGAVMELVGGGGHDPELIKAARARYLSAADPLAPCMSVIMPEDARVLCLLYLTPHLWELAGIDLGRPDPAQFPSAFKFCDVLPHERQRLRDACFGSFGKDFIILPGARDFRRLEDFTNAEFALAAGWCELAGPEDGSKACIAEAVGSVFWGGENDPRASFRFCSIIRSDLLKGSCFKRLASDIARYIADDATLRQLCARIPEEFQSGCRSKGEEILWSNSPTY